MVSSSGASKNKSNKKVGHFGPTSAVRTKLRLADIAGKGSFFVVVFNVYRGGKGVGYKQKKHPDGRREIFQSNTKLYYRKTRDNQGEESAEWNKMYPTGRRERGWTNVNSEPRMRFMKAYLCLSKEMDK